MKLPKYRRHSRGFAFVEWQRKRHYFPGPHGSRKSRAAYLEFIQQYCGPEPRTRPNEDPRDLAVAKLAILFLDHHRGAKTFTPDSLAVFRHVLGLLNEREGGLPVRDFGPVRLEAFQRWLETTAFERLHRDKAGNVSSKTEYRLGRKTINNYIGRIRQVFRWGVQKELVKPEKLIALQTVPGLKAGKSLAAEPVGREPVSWNAVEATLPHLSPTIRAMVEIQWLTGCRPQDVCGLTPADVDQTETPWYWKPPKHKGTHRGQSREIWLGPKAVARLKPWMEREPNRYCFSPAESDQWHRAQRTAARVTPQSCGNKPGRNRRKQPKRKPGEQFGSDAYRRAVERACGKAGIATWTPHQLRHSRATEVRELYGLEAAQAVLGHASLDATQIYAKRLTGEARRVAMEMG